MRLMGLTVVLGLTVATAQAADVWEKKPYGEWNEKEVLQVLTKSPWARPIPIQLSSTEARDATAFKAGVTADQRFGAENDTQYAKVEVNLVWNSRITRMAQVRQRGLKGGESDPEADAAFIEGPDPDYYVFVMQAPGFQALVDASPEDLAFDTKLLIGGRKSERTVQVERVEKPDAAQGQVAVFFVPREGNDIAVSDKQVTFEAKVGEYEVSTSFKLKDMVVEDDLEL